MEIDDFYMTSKLRWLRKKVGDDWEDIVQESRLRCMRQNAQPYYAVYLGRAVVNTAINFLKHRARVEMVSLEEREEMSFNQKENSYEMDFGLMHDLREFMMPRWNALERDVIFMYFTEQITVREAAKLLKKSRTRAHVWLGVVRDIFRKRLAEYAIN